MIGAITQSPFSFTRQGLKGYEWFLQRTLEILPGAMSWSILIGMTWMAFSEPLSAAVLIIAFYLYWLLRLWYMTFFLIISYLRLSIEKETDWMMRIHAMGMLDGCVKGMQKSPPSANLQARFSGWLYRRQLEVVARSGNLIPSAREIYHVVIIPVAKESRAIYEPGVARLIEQRFPSQQLIVVLAIEERGGEQIRLEANTVQQVYRKHFSDFLVVVHPGGLAGEAQVKGANITYAASVVAGVLQQRAISFQNVIVSCLDADTVVDLNYFSCLTYHFMICPQRTRASFQPIPVYHNNIWDVPGFARVLDVGSSFFQLVEATSPQTLVTFSSHSMSFQALVEIGYWPVDMISDDSAIFWKALIHYEGNYRVIPIPVTVSMDVAVSDSWRKTVVNVYRQKRRWAWGVENLPIVFRGFLHTKNFPLFRKLSYAFKLLEGHVSWATWSFLLGLIGWLPALFAGQEFSSSVVYYTAPRVSATIFHLALVGLGTTIVLSLCLLPYPLIGHPIMRKIGHMFEWLLVPVVAIGLSAVPALDAQTRLLLGAYLEFWVTEKKR